MNIIINGILRFFNYFFYPIPGTKFNYYILFLVIAAVLAILGFALKFYIKQQGRENKAFKRLFGSLPGKIFWIVVFLLLNMFGRYEKFPLLGARFVLYITVIAGIYILGKSAYTYLKVYPHEKGSFITTATPSQKKYTIEKHSRR